MEIIHPGASPDRAPPPRRPLFSEPIEKLPPHERALYRALRERPLSLDRLSELAGLTATELGVALVALELGGLARREPGGHARRARRS